MKKLSVNEEFVFIGYQLRVQTVQTPNYTLATNVNPFYLPGSEVLRRQYDKILLSCGVPFFIRDGEALVRACRIALSDSSTQGMPLIVRCALLAEQVPEARCDYYDEAGGLVRVPFLRDSADTDIGIEWYAAGFDVVDVSEGGGCDSAIHTYGIVSRKKVNRNGLLDSLDEACKVKSLADEDLPDHGPFTIWQVGIMPAISSSVYDGVEGKRN